MGIMQALIGAAAVVPVAPAIKNSVRFRRAATAYMNIPALGGSAQATKFTLNIWVKMTQIVANEYLFSANNAIVIAAFWNGATNPSLRLVDSANVTDVRATALNRDFTAWANIHLECDGTLAAGQRVKMYWNGVQMAVSTNTQNTSFTVGGAYVHSLSIAGGAAMDGYHARPCLLIGSALPPTAFGEFNASGVWVPKSAATCKAVVDAATDGFMLEFENATSLATLGADSSTHARNFTVTNGISVTPGVTYDQMTDTPTNNFATLNLLLPGTSALSNANLTSAGATVAPTITPTSGTWYLERDGVALTWTPPAAFPAAAGNYNFGQQPFTNTPTAPLLNSKAIGIVAPTTSGSFTGNGSTDGPVVWTGGVPVTLSIDGSANLIGTSNVDKLAGGFKLRSATNNAVGTRNWVATYASPSTNSAFGQPQPAQKNP